MPYELPLVLGPFTDSSGFISTSLTTTDIGAILSSITRDEQNRYMHLQWVMSVIEYCGGLGI